MRVSLFFGTDPMDLSLLNIPLARTTGTVSKFDAKDFLSPNQYLI
jgi:hypothetical protein